MIAGGCWWLLLGLLVAECVESSHCYIHLNNADSSYYQVLTLNKHVITVAKTQVS